MFLHSQLIRQLGGKRVYLYTENSNQLDPYASKLTNSRITCSHHKTQLT